MVDTSDSHTGVALPSAAASTATPAAAPVATHRTMEERDALPINRELSLLAFNRRVLALAQDPAVPLLERLRFLCIVSSNLDEFFEIRVAGLREQLRVKAPMVGTTLHELRAHLGEIGQGAQALVAAMYRTLNEQILPALAASGVRMLRSAERNAVQRAWVADYFQREIRPLLTPIGLDPAHPFPQVVNKSLNFIVELSGRDAFGRETSVAIVKAPRVVPRVIRLPVEVTGQDNAFVLLSSVIHAHLHELFSGRDVINYSQFRVTRDADLWIDEEEVKNLRQALEGELPQRQFGLAVRLEVAAHCPQHLATFLLQQFELQDFDLYRCEGPVNLARMSALIEQVDVDKLEYPPFLPGMPDRLRDAPDLFAAIRQHDILLHHPYQSFEPVVEFIRKATDDPDVIAIKQTVYRTGVNSVLMEALIEAARRGKEVTVVVELMARFDEEANINWAERLEQTGAQVVYGVFGLKTHAKLALLLRRERDPQGRVRLVPYAHLGTGNYHPRTTRLYTDYALLEEGVIRALYAASQAGVEIELVVRGACALRPGVSGVSDRIRVRSILGRFLEHHRIWYFENDGEPDVWLSSADWMGRNLFRRIEVAFPVREPALRKRVIDEGLLAYLGDNCDAWALGADGAWSKVKRRRGARDRRAQADLLAAMRAAHEPED